MLSTNIGFNLFVNLFLFQSEQVLWYFLELIDRLIGLSLSTVITCG